MYGNFPARNAVCILCTYTNSYAPTRMIIWFWPTLHIHTSANIGTSTNMQAHTQTLTHIHRLSTHRYTQTHAVRSCGDIWIWEMRDMCPLGWRCICWQEAHLPVAHIILLLFPQAVITESYLMLIWSAECSDVCALMYPQALRARMQSISSSSSEEEEEEQPNTVSADQVSVVRCAVSDCVWFVCWACMLFVHVYVVCM